jgi:hypothetical protein
MAASTASLLLIVSCGSINPADGVNQGGESRIYEAMHVSDDSGVSGGGSSTLLAPSNLQATALDQNNIRLTWVDNSNNETGFLVTISDDCVTYPMARTTVPAGTTTFQDSSGLAPGTTRCYFVAAFNADSQSSPSNHVFATTYGSGAWGGGGGGRIPLHMPMMLAD